VGEAERAEPELRSLASFHRRKWDVPVLLLAASVTLGYGLSLPLIYVEKFLLWDNEYSVVSGIIGLYEDEEYVLSAVILFFSFVFPIGKLLLLTAIWLARLTRSQRLTLLKWLNLLGKWSMLDVFVVAILVVAAKLGSLADVEPRNGVYLFGTAILISMLTALRIEQLARRSRG
jgi:paraquat-inducible protein A